MNAPLSHKSNCPFEGQDPKELILNGDMEFFENAETCSACTRAIEDQEIALQACISASTRQYLSRSVGKSQLSELLDLQIAESEFDKTSRRPLPDSLRRYLQQELNSETKEKGRLVIRFSDAGGRLLTALRESISVSEIFSLSPAFRNAVPAEDVSQVVIFDEKVQDNAKFTYQLIRETPEEAFLSVKVESPDLENLERVNLIRDGRFILSNHFNEQGVVNFSGLREGKYAVEFQGKGISRTLELFILFD